MALKPPCMPALPFGLAGFFVAKTTTRICFSAWKWKGHLHGGRRRCASGPSSLWSREEVRPGFLKAIWPQN